MWPDLPWVVYRPLTAALSAWFLPSQQAVRVRRVPHVDVHVTVEPSTHVTSAQIWWIIAGQDNFQLSPDLFIYSFAHMQLPQGQFDFFLQSLPEVSQAELDAPFHKQITRPASAVKPVRARRAELILVTGPVTVHPAFAQNNSGAVIVCLA